MHDEHMQIVPHQLQSYHSESIVDSSSWVQRIKWKLDSIIESGLKNLGWKQTEIYDHSRECQDQFRCNISQSCDNNSVVAIPGSANGEVDCAVCVICLDTPRRAVTLPCSHEFCGQCIDALRECSLKLLCPLCRKPIEQGVERLCAEADRLYRKIQLEVSVEAFTWSTLPLPLQSKMNNVFSLYTQAAQLNFSHAYYCLGYLIANGHGVFKDESCAAECYRKAAHLGNAQAQCNIGVMYGNGIGVPKDEAHAVEWYAKSAAQGFAQAEYNLGFMYGNGRGVTRDEIIAREWYLKAAQQGFVQAQFNLGIMFGTSHVCPRDYACAVDWFNKAAEKGYIPALCNLGFMHANGQGVPKNEKRAMELYGRAAERGFAPAQYNLGIRYASDILSPKDHRQAVKWFKKSAEQGFAPAQYNLGLMYENGFGVEKDASLAGEWYRYAAENKYVGLKSRGIKGRNIPKKGHKAIKWYRTFAEAEISRYNDVLIS